MSNLPSIAVVAHAMSPDPREAPRFARRAGFAGVAYDLFDPALSLTELSGSGRREFRHLLSAQDQRLACLRVDTGRNGIAPGADVDRVLARLDSAMETTAGLGCRRLCVEIGPLPAPAAQPAPRRAIKPEEAGLIIIPTMNQPPEPEPPAPRPADTAAMAQVDAVLVELGRKADRYGVIVALHSELSSHAALERALKSADCPWFGLDLDPASLLVDDWTLDECFARLGTLVRHVRGRDAQAGDNHRTRPAIVGQGSVVWGALLANLEAAGYHDWITLDPVELTDRRIAAEAGAAYLNQTLGGA